MIMESTIAANFPKTSQAVAERAADKAQAGIRTAQESARDAGNALSAKVADVRDEAAPMIRKAVGRAQSKAQQSFDAISDVADQARSMAADTADAIVSYTKRNPVQALAIAVASGALLYGAIKALRSFRE
jgi:ElaB/YqjD/DUF883 family membrane-anchored ribosome-binding protein